LRSGATRLEPALLSPPDHISDAADGDRQQVRERAGLIALLGSRQRERDSAIGVILAFGMGIGVLLLSFYHGFATARRASSSATSSGSPATS